MTRTLSAINVERDRARSRKSDLFAQAEALAARDTMTDGQLERAERLATGIVNIDAELATLDGEARDILRDLASDPNHIETEGEPEPRRPSHGQPMLTAAQRTIDAAFRSKQLPDYAAEKATGLIEHGSLRDRTVAAQWASATGAPAYLEAFSKVLVDPVRGHLLWSAEEHRAYQRVEEMRGMSLTTTEGGFMVPLSLDPAIMISGDGSNNPLRRISRVVQTVSNTWQGVTSAQVSGEWLAEEAEAADKTTVIAGPSIPVYKGAAYIPYTYEVGMDAVNFTQEVTKLLVDGADQLQATAYTTGAGSTEPTGIITGLVGTASEINGGGSEVLAVGDPLLLQNALPARFSARAQWCANIAIINAIGAFETTNGALRFPEVASGRLLNKPLNELSNMDGAINAAATANNYVLLYGDFQAGFVIADRIGTVVEFIPNVVGTNHRPTGQRGLFMWFRTGSDSVIDNAFRMLDVPTTA
jgi:HK97 family phage major capsid protein